MSKVLFIVEDTFQISGRGLILVPGIDLNIDVGIEIGDPILLKRPDGTIVNWTVGGIEFFTPNHNQSWPLLLKDMRKESVPIGTEVWIEDKHNDLDGIDR